MGKLCQALSATTKLPKPLIYQINFYTFPGPDKEPHAIRVSEERVTRSQMHPVPTCHFCVPLGDRLIDKAQEKPHRLKRSGGK